MARRAVQPGPTSSIAGNVIVNDWRRNARLIAVETQPPRRIIFTNDQIMGRRGQLQRAAGRVWHGLPDHAADPQTPSPTFHAEPCLFWRVRAFAPPTGEARIEEPVAGGHRPHPVRRRTEGAAGQVVGRRRIDLTAHPRPETVAPVRIQRGAFADGMPHRDLLVSPDHAIFVDGKLICARQLMNGTTIRQEKGWTSVDYYHVELDAARHPARRGAAGGELSRHRQPRLLRATRAHRWCCTRT